MGNLFFASLPDASWSLCSCPRTCSFASNICSPTPIAPATAPEPLPAHTMSDLGVAPARQGMTEIGTPLPPRGGLAILLCSPPQEPGRQVEYDRVIRRRLGALPPRDIDSGPGFRCYPPWQR